MGSSTDSEHRPDIMQLSDHDDDQLHRLALAVAKALSEVRGPRVDYNRYLSIGALIIGMISFVFGIGVNWSKVSYHDQKFGTVEARLKAVEDGQAQQVRDNGARDSAIQSQLGDIKGQLGNIQGQLQAGGRK